MSLKPRIAELPLESLIALRRNPQYLNEKQHKALIRSIRTDGFLVPIIVRPRGKRYEILSGNHRADASREAGLRSISCVVIRCSDEAAARIAVNMNTVHGEPSAELLAPFLAPLADVVLRSLYLDDRMVTQLKAFDETLRERLEKMQVPDAFDHPSPTSPLPDCVCKKCGNRHATVRKVSSSSKPATIDASKPS